LETEPTHLATHQAQHSLHTASHMFGYYEFLLFGYTGQNYDTG